MKKIIGYLIIAAIVFGGIVAWMYVGSTTAFEGNSESFVISAEKNNATDVVALLKEKKIISNGFAFSLLANQFHIWDKLKPGKFEVKKGANLVDIARMLRSNRQVSVKLIINKIRTTQDLADLLAKNFDFDAQYAYNYLTNNDSLQKFGVTAETLFTIIIPNTYEFYYNASLTKILFKIKAYSNSFWEQENRIELAANMGFTPSEVYTIASIVEEETNKTSDKGKIASVYINRLHKGMPLQADPTIRFALDDFTIKRVLEGHLKVNSPYNTYKNQGLPPGPVCTPSSNTINEVLHAPTTDYIFFVAKADFSGYSNFSNNFAQHVQYANEYRKALDVYLANKQSK